MIDRDAGSATTATAHALIRDPAPTLPLARGERAARIAGGRESIAVQRWETQMADLNEVKAKQQRMWATGDFSMIAWNTVFPGELLCEAVGLRAGHKVLDVAAGSGNAALSAARRGCEAVGIDYVPALIERARQRAAVDRLPAQFEVGDCEAIPCPDGSFDVVLSVFGSIFAPRQEKAAQELLRVCRPGGTIGMANWTPDGFWGQAFGLQAQYVPPPPGCARPSNGAPKRGCASCSQTPSARSTSRSAARCSAIAAARTGSRSSAPTSAR